MEITYVPDPSKADGKPVVAEVVALGTTVVQFATPQQVYVTGGTLATNVQFTGSISTDIGNVKIEDQNGNYAEMPAASDAKTGANKALLVQHVDETGTPLRQSTQVSIMQNQGTLATSALQATGIALASVILNNQGTQATAALQQAGNGALSVIVNNQGTQATVAAQDSQTAILAVMMNNQGTLTPATDSTTLTAVMNNQGTQATSAKQDATNNLLTVIMNAQGTQATSEVAESITFSAILNNQGTLATSAQQTAAQATLTTVMNSQGTQSTALLSPILNAFGTLATAAAQANGNTALQNLLTPILNAQGTQSTALLLPILNNQGTQATSANQETQITALNTLIDTLRSVDTVGTNLEVTLFNGVYAVGPSVAANVNGYTRHTVQHVIMNGSVAAHIETSLDGTTWNTEAVDTASNLQRLTGACKYIRAVYMGGAGTLSTFLNSAAGNGGGAPNGAGQAELCIVGTVASTLGSAVAFETGGANSLGFHYEPPAGSTSIFEGSWDGSHWVDITLRQMGAHGYTSITDDTHQDWVGSCATWRYFRLRITQGGTGVGVIRGRFSYAPSTIEGVENQAMPHRIGASSQSKSFSFTGVTSNGTIWAPTTSYHRLYITDLFFTVDATTTVIFSDGSNAEGKLVFKGKFKPASGESSYVPAAFSLPHVFTGPNRALMFTQSGGAEVDGVVHGYEAE
jgi:hypothetical protein